MAEAIAVAGALSSILQIIDFTAKIAACSHQLITASEEGIIDDQETRTLANEYKTLGQTSANLRHASNHLIEAQISRLGSQCQTQSGKLIEQLQSLSIDENSKGVKRVAEGVRKAAKRVIKRSGIEESRTHLLELNSQLATAMLQSLYAKQNEYALPGANIVAAVKAATGDDADKVLVLVEKQKRLKNRTDALLESLTFAHLTSRWNAVEPAYPQTYENFIQNDSSTLKSWLETGNGMYWITGKAGSGKSTLMKFLCNHRMSKMLLQTWCKAKKLVLAHFFFWYAGTPLQKSTEGLLRTVLHQILFYDPDLVQIAFPNQFPDEDCLLPDSWPLEELIEAAKNISEHRYPQGFEKKFCFFIDGLDEYSGNHMELVTTLRDLAQSPNVKICVSSRPWNAFRTAFESKVPNLRLEDLSRDDILRYIKGNIHKGILYSQGSLSQAQEQQLNDMIVMIADKAEGVFLWVYLVVKSVLRGLSEGDSISLLQSRVQDFPADLEDFFQNILARVDKFYKWHTSQALKLACLYTNTSGRAKEVSTFVDYWLIRQSHHGLNEVSFPSRFQVRDVSIETCNEMIAETRTMLDAACKDLLCLPKLKGMAPDTPKVEFLHRTVYDFLQTPDMQKMIDERTPDHFTDPRIFHLLNLTRLKFRMPGRDLPKALRDFSLHFEISTETSHMDLSEDYVAEFAKIAAHYDTTTLLVRPKIIITCIAFRCMDLVLRVLNSLEGYAGDHKSFNLLWRNSMVNAALGDDKRNLYSVEKINLDLVRQMRDLGIFKDFGDYQVDDGGCSSNAWQRILRKWAIYTLQNAQPGGRELRESDELRNIWELAKLMLRSGASVDEKFCANPSSATHPEHIHEECTAREFLKVNVPPAWLLECGQTSSIAPRRPKLQTKRPGDPACASDRTITRRKIK